MSRPNTGSVTVPAPAGSNGTRFIQRRTVSQFDANRAADRQRDEHRDDGDDHAAERRGVGHVVSA